MLIDEIGGESLCRMSMERERTAVGLTAWVRRANISVSKMGIVDRLAPVKVSI